MGILDLENGVPIPMGTQLNTLKRTVHADPFIRMKSDSAEIRSSTESGWPTIITGESSDSRFGVAVDYLGSWHETPVDEIDILLSDDPEWTIIVTYPRLDLAREDPNYDIGDCKGYETHEHESVDVGKTLVESFDRGAAPVFHGSSEYNSAFACHRANSYESLKEMFNLSRYSHIEKREERIYNLVVSREARWEGKDTSMQDLAKDILDSDS
ncbi:hypothetical protein [Halobacterium sp. R2-5]|uniref:hypothetical protein n=1 Tax=Halobacterium sp. R2-5 TaxID=2715751 RepID=UPI0014211DB8|nr:hypothetical protein [Halobacterium sp. R2-5]NIC00255.1 hypothetical protein [Halobacterium sp. R2-5]